MHCPRCQTENPETARYCLKCGQAFLRRCPNCQAELPHEARFCMECGQPLLVQTAVDADRLSRLAANAPGMLQQKMRSASRPAGLSQGKLWEQRTVTALLADVIASRALAKQLDLKTWTDIMNQVFDRIVQVVYRHEGTPVRLLDDSLLAFMGAPVAHEDDPLRAVRAGLEIITLMEQLAQQIKREYGVDFALRVCINTGPVEIGPLGEDLSFEFKAIGDTLNLPSRLKFTKQVMGVLTTSNTYRFVIPYFDCLDLGQVEDKGTGKEPIRVYQVLTPRSVPGRTRGFSDLASPMVGRDAEMSVLKRLCEAVRLGLGRAAIIVGEPGLGKTRLIQEWRKAIETDRAFTLSQLAENQASSRYWITGRCTAYGQGVAYWLIIDMLRDLIGVTVGSNEPEIRSALIKFTQEFCNEQIMDVYPYLGHLLSVKLEGEALERANITDPQALQTQYLSALQRLLHGCMENNPLILILEDLHWADASSIELLIKLLPLVINGPILLCLVSRPERNTPGWKLISAAREMLGGSVTSINLNPLNEADSRVLVANLLQLESLPEEVRELILKKAEGNPYFVEEVIRMLIDREVIIEKDGSWVAREEISAYDIPDNLQGLLLARIDRLPSEARYTLLVASVIGRNFPVKVLSQVMEGT
ncbi:MAG: ATP-binding protein [Acidobacteriaceae bacterium]